MVTFDPSSINVALGEIVLRYPPVMYVPPQLEPLDNPTATNLVLEYPGLRGIHAFKLP